MTKIESKIGTIARTERSLTTNEKKEMILLIIYNIIITRWSLTIGSKVPRKRWSRITAGQSSCQRKPRILTLCNWVLLCERAACAQSFVIYHSHSSCNVTFICDVLCKGVPRLRMMLLESDAIHMRFWRDTTGRTGFFFFFFFVVIIISRCWNSFLLSVRPGFFHPRSFILVIATIDAIRGNIYARLFEVNEK